MTILQKKKKKKKKVNERVREEPFLDYSKEWSVLQNNLEIELVCFFDNLSVLLFNYLFILVGRRICVFWRACRAVPAPGACGPSWASPPVLPRCVPEPEPEPEPEPRSPRQTAFPRTAATHAAASTSPGTFCKKYKHTKKNTSKTTNKKKRSENFACLRGALSTPFPSGVC